MKQEENNQDIVKESMDLSREEIHQLVHDLESKDDQIRYRALQLLEARSDFYEDCYPYFSHFVALLQKENAYSKMVGMSLLSINVKWDHLRLFDDLLDEFLTYLHDDKPIVVRKCFVALTNVLPFRREWLDRIEEAVKQEDFSRYQDSMRPLLEQDRSQFLNYLEEIRSIEN